MALQELVIVTGLSGAGKRSIIKAFEDLGYYCVDNLPARLIPELLELSSSSGGEINRLAVVIDVRSGEFLSDFKSLHRYLLKQDFKTLVIFLEASDEVLVKRFQETRRPHPLAPDRPILEGIALERKRMQKIRELADMIIDTSDFTVHNLKRYVIDRFKDESRRDSLLITVVSFGFKYGIPIECDLLFDVRFLPNPNFVRRLKKKTGRDKSVIAYMKAIPEAQEVIGKLNSFLDYMMPKYVREGKAYLTIAIGCTGGRHRSVFVADALRDHLARKGYRVKVIHRDIDKG